MRLICKTLNELTPRQVYEMLKARNEIFVCEQECIFQDCDDFDFGLHVFYEDDEGRVHAYMRMYEVTNDDMADFELMGEDGRGTGETVRYTVRPGVKTVQMGRVLTIKHGEGLGGKLLREGIKAARDIMNADMIYIEAETYVVGYYERENFRLCSKEFLKDDIPHKMMELKLR